MLELLHSTLLAAAGILSTVRASEFCLTLGFGSSSGAKWFRFVAQSIPVLMPVCVHWKTISLGLSRVKTGSSVFLFSLFLFLILVLLKRAASVDRIYDIVPGSSLHGNYG